MPEMISKRGFTLRTRRGHVVAFEADKPTNVPDIIVSDAEAAGCMLVDAEKPKRKRRSKAEMEADAGEGTDT